MKINFLNWRWGKLHLTEETRSINIANCNGEHIRIKAVIVDVAKWKKLNKDLNNEQ